MGFLFILLILFNKHFLYSNYPLFIQCRDALNEIITMGHSRVPVYSGDPANIIGLILVKFRHRKYVLVFFFAAIEYSYILFVLY